MVSKTKVFTNVWQTGLKLRPGLELAADERVGKGGMGGEGGYGCGGGGAGQGGAAGCYVIVPSTFEPGLDGSFNLQVLLLRCTRRVHEQTRARMHARAHTHTQHWVTRVSDARSFRAGRQYPLRSSALPNGRTRPRYGVMLTCAHARTRISTSVLMYECVRACVRAF